MKDGVKRAQIPHIIMKYFSASIIKIYIQCRCGEEIHSSSHGDIISPTR